MLISKITLLWSLVIVMSGFREWLNPKQTVENLKVLVSIPLADTYFLVFVCFVCVCKEAMGKDE